MSDAPAATSTQYQGDELALFAHAVNWKRYLTAVFRPYLGREVLEVGAGLGSATRTMYTGQERWVCLEPDPTMAAGLHAAVVAGTLPAACAAETGTVADLLARGERDRFDSVIYVDVLEHIADDRDELARAIQLVRPAGHLVVMSPALQWLYTPFDAAIGHVRRYDRARMAEVAPPAARLVTLRYLDSVGLLASLANRLLLRAAMPTPGQILTWDRLMVPLSRVADPLLRHTIGKSILAVWTR